MPTILTKKSDTPGAVPATANLTNAAGGAELAVNTADKRLFALNSSSAVVEIGTNPGSLTTAEASATVFRSGSATITNLIATSLTVSSGSTLNGGVVINELGADADTRIEGDTDANLFFVDASTDRIGIGTSSPAYKLDVQRSGSGFVSRLGTASAANLLIYTDSASAYLSTDTGLNNNIRINGTDNTISFFTNNQTERLQIDASGNLGLGGTPKPYLNPNYNAFDMHSGRTVLMSSSGTPQTNLQTNAYYDSTDSRFEYSQTGYAASNYVQQGGEHKFLTAPSGTAGNPITFTQAMTLSVTGANSNNTTLNLKGGAGAGSDVAQIDFERDGSAVLGSIKLSRDGGNGNGAMQFFTNNGTSNTERARITSGGDFYVGTTSAVGSGGLITAVQSLDNNAVISSDATNASFIYNNVYINCTRSASANYSFIRGASGGYADTEFYIRGDGNAYADGTWNNNGADYAEFFESATGGALTVGATVVLDGNKVREATASDPVSAIMGVVRPKEPGKASMVVGNTAWNKWANKYLTDDFDRYIMEDHDVVEWTDEDGKQHSYESHNIPDGVTVPADAVVKTHDDKGNKFQHYKLNPAWDKDAEYTPREKRDEWIIVGLVGQVKVLKGQPVNDRWIKMRDVSATVEEWMIR